MGLSVKGDSITLIADCDQSVTRPLDRNSNSTLNIKGLIILGQQLSDDDVFTVSFFYFHIRHLYIIENTHFFIKSNYIKKIGRY